MMVGRFRVEGLVLEVVAFSMDFFASRLSRFAALLVSGGVAGDDVAGRRVVF